MADDPKLDNVVNFVPADVYDREIAMSGELNRLAGTPGPDVRLPKHVSRQRVVMAFADAFEMIGGIPRLAAWANEHETEFYKLYGKLLPSGASQALGETNELIVRHVLPPGPLDVSHEKK